jgi:hypothetical protein
MEEHFYKVLHLVTFGVIQEFLGHFRLVNPRLFSNKSIELTVALKHAMCLQIWLETVLTLPSHSALNTARWLHLRSVSPVS